MCGGYGLKDCLRRNPRVSLKQYFRNLFREIRYAWQRAWRGYDDTDVFDLAYNFTKRMVILLREFKKHNDALFKNVDRGDSSSLTEEETNAVLDEMIFYFENCNPDMVFKRLYGDKPLSESEVYDATGIVTEEEQRCWEIAMQLFAKWSRCLWF